MVLTAAPAGLFPVGTGTVALIPIDYASLSLHGWLATSMGGRGTTRLDLPHECIQDITKRASSRALVDIAPQPFRTEHLDEVGPRNRCFVFLWWYFLLAYPETKSIEVVKPNQRDFPQRLLRGEAQHGESRFRRSSLERRSLTVLSAGGPEVFVLPSFTIRTLSLHVCNCQSSTRGIV